MVGQAKARKAASRVKTSGSPAMAKIWGCRASHGSPRFMVWLERSMMVSAVLGPTFAARSWKKDALEGFNGGRADTVVESNGVGSGGTEEEVSEESEGEGAHLRGEWRREDKVMSLEDSGEGLTSSVSAEVANWANTRR